MKANQEQGRPVASGNMHIEPEFLEKPDIQKLGRALIDITKNIVEKKKAEERTAADSGGKGEAVP